MCHLLMGLPSLELKTKVLVKLFLYVTETDWPVYRSSLKSSLVYIKP